MLHTYFIKFDMTKNLIIFLVFRCTRQGLEAGNNTDALLGQHGQQRRSDGLKSALDSASTTSTTKSRSQRRRDGIGNKTLRIKIDFYVENSSKKKLRASTDNLHYIYIYIMRVYRT